jgi:uncharacterized membrane protein YphA (DoxX/SURF4 family)
MGFALQRLFSMFPNGLPGAGLLLLRLVCGVIIIAGAVTTIAGAPGTQTLILQTIALPAALLLLAGLWTPIAGLVIVLIALWMGLSGAKGTEIAVLLATIGAALAALGPGSHSVDAKLYGRKRIQIQND